MTYTTSTATLSACGLYRYDLQRLWGPAPPVLFLMLNPSTADHTRDDPTVLRCVGFGRRWGYGGVVVVNLFAFRSSHPKDLLHAVNPVGPDNDAAIRRWAGTCGKVVAAWGASIAGLNRFSLKDRPRQVREALAEMGVDVFHLGHTEGGFPKHPLARGSHRIPDDVEPRPYPRAVLS